MSYILRYVSFAEVGRICRAVFREPMNLCTYVSEEGDDGEATCSETPSLLSYILRYDSFVEVDRICRAVLREPMHLCTCVREKGGGGEAACSETPSLLSYILRYDRGLMFLFFLVFTFFFSPVPLWNLFECHSDYYTDVAGLRTFTEQGGAGDSGAFWPCSCKIDAGRKKTNRHSNWWHGVLRYSLSLPTPSLSLI
jgi:hypothetical protein